MLSRLTPKALEIFIRLQKKFFSGSHFAEVN